MIESIHISSVATFSDTPESLAGLSKFNFLYGSNGSGKTTITRVIAEEQAFPTCNVTWKGGARLQTMVYNRDFVENNFNQSSELRGVFTLGEHNIETLKSIAAAKAELDAITKQIETLNLTLQGHDGNGGKKGELATLEEELKTKCWAQKQKHDTKLSGALEGVRNNAEKFKAKVLQERTTNSATVETLANLERKAETIFGPVPIREQPIQTIEPEKVLAHESNPILKKRVIGKADVDIAAMIQKLSNSDWVREGRRFYEANDMICPFCQQDTTEAFAKSLNDYFDEAFVTDSKAIEDLSTNHSTDCSRLQQQIAAIIANPSRFLDIEKLKAEKELLDSRITINIQRIVSKKKEPSQVVDLDSVSNSVVEIKSLIDAANAQITAHNKTIANLSSERRTLTEQVWKYLVEVELKTDLTNYDTKRDAVTKAINGLTAKITSSTSEKNKTSSEIRALEKITTSIQPTIDGINLLLVSFGFLGFSLAKATTGASYKLVRPDNTDAKETLSEGERSFVTFLYFYHLLKGSNSETGITTDRIVVFDDPVSSLDSDILFIVGSLIKGLFDEVRKGTGYIKQIFVFTHNVYFHKEVTFNPLRRDIAMNEETFWVVRKAGLVSKLESHKSNPINTSYGLLWSEVRRPDRSNLAIQNTLRRILENYFRILGEVDPDTICAKFDGKERLICKALFSWVNDGSHFALDDVFISIDDSTVDTYLSVFKAIFEKSGHLAHYAMMMGGTEADNSLKAIPA